MSQFALKSITARFVPAFALAMVLFCTSGAEANPYCPYNETDYLAFNPDVVYAIQTGAFASGNEHYLRHGQYENRVVNYACANGKCPFVASDYLDYNPDVAQAIRNGHFTSAEHHYAQHGHAENRVINRYCAGSTPVACQFNETDYLAYNPDVVYAIQTGAFSSGYDHYSRHGVNENRVVNYACANGKCPFVARDYLDFNPDVAEAVRNGHFISAEHHYAQHGNRENRITNRYCR